VGNNWTRLPQSIVLEFVGSPIVEVADMIGRLKRQIGWGRGRSNLTTLKAALWWQLAGASTPCIAPQID
jgi:hypothetical protein